MQEICRSRHDPRPVASAQGAHDGGAVPKPQPSHNTWPSHTHTPSLTDPGVRVPPGARLALDKSAHSPRGLFPIPSLLRLNDQTPDTTKQPTPQTRRNVVCPNRTREYTHKGRFADRCPCSRRGPPSGPGHNDDDLVKPRQSCWAAVVASAPQTSEGGGKTSSWIPSWIPSGRGRSRRSRVQSPAR